MKRKILLIDLWGVGDLTFASSLLREALNAGDEVHLLGKSYASALLAPTFPELHFIPFDAPWTRFRGKYRLWNWNWPELSTLILRLRHEHYDVGVSVRNDPRDHVLSALAGTRARYGFATKGSGVFLTHPVRRSLQRKQHKVEDWRDIGTALGVPNMRTADPYLNPTAYRSPRIDALLTGVHKPLLCLHTGARIPVRRWPEPYFEEIIRRLRGSFDFHLVLIPDPDGYGKGLAPLADGVACDLKLGELVDLLGRSNLLLCNDSGPGHLAAACGRPTIAMFGPTDPDWFRPWGPLQKVVIRDICPLRPCFDYCRFAEPRCMTKLLPVDAWEEICGHILLLVKQGVIPESLNKALASVPSFPQ